MAAVQCPASERMMNECCPEICDCKSCGHVRAALGAGVRAATRRGVEGLRDDPENYRKYGSVFAGGVASEKNGRCQVATCVASRILVYLDARL